MPRIAFTTFAIMQEPYGHEVVRGFEDLTPLAFEQAENSHGFIDRAKEIDESDSASNFERDWGAWGQFCVPRFYTGGRTSSTDSRASTLSLWESIEAVHQFVYSSLHLEALQQRHLWFLKPQWPSYAIWWVADDHIPSWAEACQRLEHLHDHGQTPVAFDFRKPFDEYGNLYTIKKRKLQSQV
jgi:hypothetical protein